jgi:toxin-antitoxin system PIN domain toxin
MLCVDVNVLVHAFRPSSPRHEGVREWLEATLAAREPIALFPEVASGFTRVVTNPRIFSEPSSPARALEFVQAFVAAPRVHVISPGTTILHRFMTLVDHHQLKGNDIPDAFLAACVIDFAGTLVTCDRGFRRFADLRVIELTT